MNLKDKSNYNDQEKMILKCGAFSKNTVPGFRATFSVNQAVLADSDHECVKIKK